MERSETKGRSLGEPRHILAHEMEVHRPFEMEFEVAQ